MQDETVTRKGKNVNGERRRTCAVVKNSLKHGLVTMRREDERGKEDGQVLCMVNGRTREEGSRARRMSVLLHV